MNEFKLLLVQYKIQEQKNSSLSCPGARVWAHREFAKVTRIT